MVRQRTKLSYLGRPLISKQTASLPLARKKPASRSLAFRDFLAQYRTESALLNKRWQERAPHLSPCSCCNLKNAALASEAHIVGGVLSWAIRIICPVSQVGTPVALTLDAALVEWQRRFSRLKRPSSQSSAHG